MVPDKIYIRNYMSDNFTDFGAYYELEDGTVLDAEFYLKTQKHESIVANIEYIRKDAMLERAKEQKTLMQLGGHVSIDDVIDKLNSF